jgi:ribokinase
MAKRIVVVGSINLDLVAATERIPIAGETVAGLSFRTFPGGKGANQAVVAERLDGTVSMIGKLGADAFGVQLRDSLEESKVNTEAVEVTPGSSGVAPLSPLIRTEKTQSRSLPARMHTCLRQI